MCEDELAQTVVDVLGAGVVEAHVEFYEQAHHEVEVEVRDERVGVDVADGAGFVGDVEDELLGTGWSVEISKEEIGGFGMITHPHPLHCHRASAR